MKNRLLLLCWSLFSFQAFGQADCQNNDNFTLIPSTQNRLIDWQKFPEFSLPFVLVYNGPFLDNNIQNPLKHGFSHLAGSQAFDKSLTTNQRAVIWYGPAYPKAQQPWETIKSPWSNDLNLYRSNWRRELAEFANFFDSRKIEADIFVPDIEAQLKSNDSILVLKKHPSTPDSYKLLDNATFIRQYKQDLQNLYTEVFNESKAFLLPSTKIGGYADVPILNTYINIVGNSWEKWTKDVNLLNYINYDFNTNSIGGSVYQSQTTLFPSAYYYYAYPHPLAPDYLAYLLFQVESNMAWSSKDVIPFVWLRHSYNPAFAKKWIQPFMAESTAIFPLMSGAKGIWLWDDPTTFQNDDNFALYEYFIKGLYRISLFKDMFQGKIEYVNPNKAPELIDARKPIWRAVVKNNQILVAAHNPYAKDEKEETVVEIAYKNYRQIIKLTGYEVFLCKFDMNLLENEQYSNNINIYPNPASEVLEVNFRAIKPENIEIKLFDSTGKIIFEVHKKVNFGENQHRISLQNIENGVYFCSIANQIKKIIISK